MNHLLRQLHNKGLITSPPYYVIQSLQYLVMMGSVAYGVSNNTSDIDVYGFCIPPHDVIFPYEHGYIPGFGQKPPAFEQWQQHHVIDKEVGKEYDFTVYNIVKFFQLTMECNPNMIDALFVPDRCVLYQTDIAKKVRENKELFLSKKAWHKFKGYAYSQLQKMRGKALKKWVDFCNRLDLDPLSIHPVEIKEIYGYESPEHCEAVKLYKQVSQGGRLSKRISSIVKYGYDVKFAYHIVRLLLEIEQILAEGKLDLERNREILKSIRRGEWSIEKVENFFESKESDLERLYHNSSLPYSPREQEIKELLLECLNTYFGSLGSSFNKFQVKEKVRAAIDLLDRAIKELD